MPDRDQAAGRSRTSVSLRRLWWLPLLLALVGAGAGVWYGAGQPVRASAVVLVNPLEGNPFSPSGTGEDLLNLESEAQLLASDRVAEAAATKLGFTGDPQDLLGRVSAEVPPNTQLLEVKYRARKRATAVARAEAFAEAFLVVRTERADRLLQAQRATIQSQLDAATAQQTRLAGQRQVAVPARIAEIDAQLGPIGNRVRSLTSDLEDLPTGTSSPGTVVNRAYVTRSFGPVPPAVVYGVAGGVVLLVLGLALALLLGGSGGKVRRSSDVSSSGLTVLTTMSRRRAERSRSGLLIDRDLGPDAQTAVESDMQRLRAAVLMRRSHPLPITLLVTTLSSTQPSSLTGAGLALSLARSNLRVALLDLGQEAARPSGRDRGAPAVTGPGLAQVIREGLDVSEVLTPIAVGVDQVPAGSLGDDLEDLLVNPVLEKVLANLARTHDVVLLAGGSLESPSVQSLIELADGVLVEVWEGVSTMHDVIDLAQLEALSSRLNGVVYLSASSRA